MIEILTPGMGVTLQDYPGRTGYWNVGLPPSGPMDALSFRIANKIAGNSDCAVGMEITALGPSLKFREDAQFVLGGAKFSATLDGKPVPWWRRIQAKQGSVLNVGALSGQGFRCYLAVRGGFDVPYYLNSRSTFVNGGIGGFEGRYLKAGDLLSIGSDIAPEKERPVGQFHLEPEFPDQWVIGAVVGPQGAPEYVTQEYLDAFFSSEFTVSSNSNRMGVRLMDGPKPIFSRPDGGEGGSHPSNIVDTPYPIGAITISGDTPIILSVDGPSFGGFITFATVPKGEMWKLGQLKLGGKVRFTQVTLSEAERAEVRFEQLMSLI